jgi:hypothetical protein
MTDVNDVIVADGFVFAVECLVCLLVFGVAAFLLPNSLQIIRFLPYSGKLVFKTNIYYAVLLALLFFGSILTFVGDASPSEFLYFNF